MSSYLRNPGRGDIREESARTEEGMKEFYIGLYSMGWE